MTRGRHGWSGPRHAADFPTVCGKSPLRRICSAREMLKKPFCSQAALGYLRVRRPAPQKAPGASRGIVGSIPLARGRGFRGGSACQNRNNLPCRTPLPSVTLAREYRRTIDHLGSIRTHRGLSGLPIAPSERRKTIFKVSQLSQFAAADLGVTSSRCQNLQVVCEQIIFPVVSVDPILRIVLLPAE